MNYSKFSLFDRQIFDLFEKKNIPLNENFYFPGDFQETFPKKISRRLKWNSRRIPGDFQEVATLRHAHKDAIRNFINNKFRIFQARPGPARPDAIHEICRPGPARARGVEARPGPARSYIQILQARARPAGPGRAWTL